MARKRLPKTRYRSPKGRAETGAPLPLNKLLLGAKQVPIRKELPWHTTPHDGLLEGCKGDIYKMVQMAQYECFKSDLYDHREDICRYGTLDQLRDMGVYAIRESLADEILNDLSYDEDYAPTDDAKDTIMGAVSAAFEERYGEDFAEIATDFGQDIDDIAGRANPYVLSVDTVRAVNEKGYDAVFAGLLSIPFRSGQRFRRLRDSEGLGRERHALPCRCPP